MTKKLLTLTAFAVLLVTAPGLQAQNAQWIHLNVTEGSDSSIRLNLPIEMATMALEALRSGALSEARSTSPGDGFTMSDLQTMWTAMRDAGTAEFLNLQDGQDQIRVFREGDRLFVHAEEGGETSARVEMPISIADALLDENAEAGDLNAAIQALAGQGGGELVLIQDDESTVRLWADDQPGQE